MNMAGGRPHRKTPVHYPVRQAVNRPAIVLVTVCTDKRKAILCRDEAHTILVDVWNRAGAWCVGRYVLMPDHIHLFASPATFDGPSLARWVQYWKALASRAWPWPEEQPIWERSFWDRQLRRGERYAAKWHYIRENPVRKGLAATADDWPYQGELNVLTWQD